LEPIEKARRAPTGNPTPLRAKVNRNTRTLLPSKYRSWSAEGPAPDQSSAQSPVRWAFGSAHQHPAGTSQGHQAAQAAPCAQVGRLHRLQLRSDFWGIGPMAGRTWRIHICTRSLKSRFGEEENRGNNLPPCGCPAAPPLRCGLPSVPSSSAPIPCIFSASQRITQQPSHSQRFSMFRGNVNQP